MSKIFELFYIKLIPNKILFETDKIFSVTENISLFRITFSELGRDRFCVNTFLVPLSQRRKMLYLLFLLPLVFQGRSLGVEVPRRIGNVLRDVRVDVFALLVNGGRSVTQFSGLFEFFQLFVITSAFLTVCGVVVLACGDQPRDGHFRYVCHFCRKKVSTV